jgi:hypothetical protein
VDDAGLSEAAKLALNSPAMIHAIGLSAWIAESGPRPVTKRQVLRKQDVQAAAAATGVTAPEKLRAAADIPALDEPWKLALATGLLRIDGDTVTAGPKPSTKEPPIDQEILAAWLDGLLAASEFERNNTAAGDTLVFLTTAEKGTPLEWELATQASQLTRRIGWDTTTSYWPEERIAITAERLTSFGAISGGAVTPLGQWAARRLLEKLGKPAADLTAAQLIAYLADRGPDDRGDKAWAWLQAQPDQAEAARQVLTAGAPMEPRLRWIAAYVVELLDEDALPVWREMTAVPGIGPHAKYSLYTMEAGPEPNDGEWLWLIVESVAVALAEQGPDEAVTVLWEALPAQRLAADDLEHRLAIVRATDHPSALSLAAAIEDFVASAGAESLSVNQCLRLKISLANWRPPIWRIVLIPATASLAALHRAIQILYGWDGDHMHAFRVRRTTTYSDPSFRLEEARSEYDMRVLAALEAGGGKISYEYDFGASWNHEIVLQKRVSREPGAVYPVCVKYSGDSPVEYPDYDDDEDEQHEEPEPFDLEAVNRRLSGHDATA